MFRPFSRGGSKPYSSFELVERHQLGLLGDADGALALHVGVAAHRADAGAGLADIAAQQQQVDEHLHVLDAVAVLRQPHAVDADHALGARRRSRAAASSVGARAGRTRARSSSQSRARIACRERLEAVRVLGDEVVVEHARSRRGSRASSSASMHAPCTCRSCAAMSPPALHLVVLRADLRSRRPVSISRGDLRVGEALQPALAQRIEGDDRHAALARILQLVQHARAVAADVLAEEEDAVASARNRRASRCRPARRCVFGSATEVLSWHMFELSGRLLLPYSRANSCVHVGGLERGAARGVEDHRLRARAPSARAPISAKASSQRHRHVSVARGVPAHRLRSAGPAASRSWSVQASSSVTRVLGEERRRAALAGDLPGGRLGAVLAELERRAGRPAWPRRS